MASDGHQGGHPCRRPRHPLPPGGQGHPQGDGAARGQAGDPVRRRGGGGLRDHRHAGRDRPGQAQPRRPLRPILRARVPPRTEGQVDELAEMRAIADLARRSLRAARRAARTRPRRSVARQHVGDQPFAVSAPRRHHAPPVGDPRRHAGRLRAAALDRAVLQAGHARRDLAVRLPSPPSRAGDDLVRVHDVIEKPTPEEAPSDLGIMGRYVFTPDIFDAIDQTKPGRGGEIQLTDAVKILLATEPVYGYTFERGPLRRRQQARLPPSRGRTGPRARGPRARRSGPTSTSDSAGN